ncbi:MAG: 16S rRNA (guanine(966)-N(2))-methyltransferase RsmD [Oscillospiraceae bacterium]|nr:16S rRNA (guanine(966)-N(2))-methyltransferase RsmD [Oscillospiraceae bacterium]
MRIITGTARGRKLKALKSDDASIRPTADSVKEAIFNAIQFEVENKTIADLFAGTGQLGLEALSRGASRAYFADNSAESINIIRENIKRCGFTEKAEVSSLSASAFLKKTTAFFDIAFLDPPYGLDLISRTLNALIPRMSENGIIVCEHEKECKTKEDYGDFKIRKTYNHGKTNITIYEYVGAEPCTLQRQSTVRP